ncbi:MAG: hypothetical protein EBZ59_01905 [Planctomycetia bacterium]|nr:hypothetical protein [Planctomycetia bacterium]
MRRFLVRGVLLSLLLPVVLAVVVGLGGLLSSLGDESGGIACGRLALVLGVAWVVSIAATAVTTSLVVLDGPLPRGHFDDGPRPSERDSMMSEPNPRDGPC